MADAAQNSAIEAQDDAARSQKRKSLLLGVAGLVGVAAVVAGGWYVLVGSHHVTTDNAYVGADTATITPMVAGQVAEVDVQDTQVVHKGDVLVRIDPRDAQIALAQAEADLAKARRQYGQTSFATAALAAQIKARQALVVSSQAQLASAQAAYDKAKIDLDRRRALAPKGAVSGDELTNAINAFAAARASLEQARASVMQAGSNKGVAQGDFSASSALIEGTTLTNNPDVLAAQAKVDQAKLDLERTVIRAPIDGVVASRAVQVGQRVAAGNTLMRVVPINALYVDANYKESQLAKVRIGQSVELTSDRYGSGVVFHGKVAGFSGGTGSAFALIPAQNATGNWIKIVQRLPVRVTLDPKELAEHPLRVGLSMDADIDITSEKN
ncbi:MAG: HlyD family efflux transporter periplasmic adaptor subunit [Sphingomonadales bacterium]|nr:HlyD family efflux transporter periplasmic adaptor subunit [Sphingomonadales bacterium]MDE2172131.1 HlyD family efflux transporter periplasmic adaptor subunit [Sphingomonadales bacterium]